MHCPFCPDNKFDPKVGHAAGFPHPTRMSITEAFGKNLERKGNNPEEVVRNIIKNENYENSLPTRTAANK